MKTGFTGWKPAIPGLPPVHPVRPVHFPPAVDALRLLQAETATELDALLPTLLDRAFKGEL